MIPRLQKISSFLDRTLRHFHQHLFSVKSHYFKLETQALQHFIQLLPINLVVVFHYFFFLFHRNILIFFNHCPIFLLGQHLRYPKKNYSPDMSKVKNFQIFGNAVFSLLKIFILPPLMWTFEEKSYLYADFNSI